MTLPKMPLVALLALVAVAATGPVRAADALTDAQKQAMEAVIKDYLMANPEVIIEALEAYEQKQRLAQAEQRKKALASMREVIENSPTTPVYGNPDGDVTIVEFFDYSCGYCKRVFPEVVDLVENDGKIRYVLKELPILSEVSNFAARAALGVWNLAPEKYFEFHTVMMEMRGGLTEAKVLKAATEAGIDQDKLEAEMKSQEVATELGVTRHMAQLLGITGTPAFIIGDGIFPGALPRERLERIVAQAREG